jgi:hypothetical protein
MTVELDLVQESWQELKKYINTMDRPDAAEGLVSVLVENGVAAEDIQTAFGNDPDIRSALSMYLDDTGADDEDNDYDELNFDDD